MRVLLRGNNTPTTQHMPAYCTRTRETERAARGTVSRGKPRGLKVDKDLGGRVGSRTGNGSARARLPDGAWLSRPHTDPAVRWHTLIKQLGKDEPKAAEHEVLLYQLAGTCTPMVVEHGGAVGDIARSMRGVSAVPLVRSTQIRLLPSYS